LNKLDRRRANCLFQNLIFSDHLCLAGSSRNGSEQTIQGAETARGMGNVLAALDLQVEWESNCVIPVACEAFLGG